MARATSLAGFLCLLASHASGQFQSERTPFLSQQDVQAPHFSGDYACFGMSDSLTFTEFYFQIPFQNLRFVRHDDGFHAEYEIELYVENHSGELAYSKSGTDTIHVNRYAETIDAESARAIQFTTYLRPEIYRLRALITDRETGRHTEARTELRIKDFRGETLSMSNLQFSSAIETVCAPGNFVKNNRHVVPNVMHAYGQSSPQLFVYYEIYNLSYAAPGDSFQTIVTIQRENGDRITQMKRYQRKPGASCVQSLCLPIADFPKKESLKSSSPGGAGWCDGYQLHIEVTDSNTGQRAESAGRFIIKRQAFTFSDYAFDELVEQLRPIASDKELRKLQTIDDVQGIQAIAKFWQAKDPTPGTLENELMDEYYRRVKVAEYSFNYPHGRGWESPQGKVYVAFGPPDDVQRIESIFPDPNYEIWEYGKLDRRFVFAEVSKDRFELLDAMSRGGLRPRRR